jgi:hypothetical protein
MKFAQFAHPFGNISHRDCKPTVRRWSRKSRQADSLGWNGRILRPSSLHPFRRPRAGRMEAELQHCDEEILFGTPRKDFG